MPLPPEATLDDVHVAIRRTNTNPNVGDVSKVTLKEGPQTYKIATLFEVLKPDSRELHHYYLRLDHITRKRDGWSTKPEKSTRLDDDDGEVRKLYMFLAAVYAYESG